MLSDAYKPLIEFCRLVWECSIPPSTPDDFVEALYRNFPVQAPDVARALAMVSESTAESILAAVLRVPVNRRLWFLAVLRLLVVRGSQCPNGTQSPKKPLDMGDKMAVP
jgi:hypothetical protein